LKDINIKKILKETSAISTKGQVLYHLLDRSPWPIISALSAMVFVLGIIMFFNRIFMGLFLLYFGLFILLAVVILWFRDIVRESTFRGQHTIVVQRGLKIGFILFIMSEVMLFFALFWSFFHVSLSPAVELGCYWPPVGIVTLNPWGFPLLNTFLLLCSGASITCVHYSIILDKKSLVWTYYLFTIFLGFFFILVQVYEYITAPFNITDSVYGSIFYMLTGLHGLHVQIGIIFLMVGLVRFMLGHFTVKHHLGFTFAAWYWHFVDIVWILVFIFIYVWGSW
jgi:cytochrome c oxidase subunit 3